MIGLLIICGLSFGAAAIFLLKNAALPALEKILTHLHFLALGGSILSFFLMTKYYRLLDWYVKPFFALLCLCTAILVYGLTRTNWKKIYTGLFAIPAFISGVLGLLVEPFWLPWFLAWVLFGPPEKRFEPEEGLVIETALSGFKACGSSFHLIEREYGVLQRIIPLGQRHCLEEVQDLKIIEWRETEFCILDIYHEDRHKMNPIRDTIDLGRMRSVD
ncbi:MAG: hypothetical protein AAF587_36445 [Bacteroidota bacterium]